MVNEHQNNWDDYLEDVAFSIRTQRQKSTKYTPFFLMFGREARTPLEVCIIVKVTHQFHLQVAYLNSIRTKTVTQSDFSFIVFFIDPI